MSQSRQLAAIMFTDIVGFTALMGRDEHRTFEILEKNRQLHKPIISEYGGRWIKEMGDGVMATFSTVSNAVNAAIKIMDGCQAANEYQLCIGINLAEVVFENDDVFGDGVNVAARVQSAAFPGSIFITESVYRSISNKSDIRTNFVREEQLKNVSEPVRLYQVITKDDEQVKQEALRDKTIDAKSIAVLPFANMSNDPDQEYFSDGISEEIINVLAQVPEMKVIGRTSSFAFKGKNQDLREIGKLLSVRYVLEGSVRKAGNKLRITAQLINVADGFHLYSEKFDRELEDVFAIQDEISLSILNAIKVKLLGEQKDATLSKGTTNLGAYQLFLQGRYWFNKYHPEAFAKAIEFYKAAIQADPNYALAYAEMAICYADTAYFKWLPRDQCMPHAIAAAHKALELDDRCVESHIALGRIKLWHEYRLSEAFNSIQAANRINPNHVEGLRQLCVYNMILGDFSKGYHYMQKAEEVDPYSLLNLFYLGLYCWWDANIVKMHELGTKLKALEPQYSAGYLLTGMAYNIGRQYELAIPELEWVAKMNPDMLCLESLALAYARQGDESKASKVLEQMENSPLANESHIFIGTVYRYLEKWDEAFEHYSKGVAGHEAHAIAIGTWKIITPGIISDPRYAALAKKVGVPLN